MKSVILPWEKKFPDERQIDHLRKTKVIGGDAASLNKVVH